MNIFENFLSRIIDIPPLEDRVSKTFMPLSKFFHGNLDISKDIDFIVITLSLKSMIVSFSLSLFVIIDAFFQLNIYVDYESFKSDPVEMYNSFGRLIIAPMVLIFFIFYLRIKLSFDISKEHIPIPSHSAYLNDLNRSNWIKRSVFALFCMTMLLLFSAVGASGIVSYFQIGGDAGAVALVTIVLGFAISSIPSIVLMQCLIFEKAYFHFEAFKEQLKFMKSANGGG